MDEQVMVHKVNQIALFFASYPREEAIAGIADHLLKFWEPRMLRQLQEYVATGAAALHELAPEAIRLTAQATTNP